MSYIYMCDKGDMYNQCLWKINCPLSQFTGNYSLCIIKVDWTHVHQSDKTQLIVANNTQQIPLTVRVITFFFAAFINITFSLKFGNIY